MAARYWVHLYINNIYGERKKERESQSFKLNTVNAKLFEPISIRFEVSGKA